MPQLEPPATWGEVDAFIKVNRLDQDEYFMMDSEIAMHDPVWTSETWRIPIWMCEGSNEGFYLHIEEILIVKDAIQMKKGRPQSRFLGKFWSIQTAMQAQNLLWHFIYGFRPSVQVQPLWSEMQVNDWLDKNDVGPDLPLARRTFHRLLEAVKEPPPYEKNPQWAKAWAGG